MATIFFVSENSLTNQLFGGLHFALKGIIFRTLLHVLNISFCHLISPFHISWRPKEEIEILVFSLEINSLYYFQSIHSIALLLIESNFFPNISCFLKGKVQGILKL